MAKIILASGSPRRQELLGRIGVKDFEVVVPQVEETYPAGLNPEETVCYISREKSDAAARLCAADDIIITADTMVFLDDKRLGKPHGEEEALTMLTALAGRHHTVCTGVTVRRGEPMDKAGAYGVQGQGALLVERIDGDFFNVMGLPVLLLSRMLAQVGVNLLD